MNRTLLMAICLFVVLITPATAAGLRLSFENPEPSITQEQLMNGVYFRGTITNTGAQAVSFDKATIYFFIGPPFLAPPDYNANWNATVIFPHPSSIAAGSSYTGDLMLIKAFKPLDLWSYHTGNISFINTTYGSVAAAVWGFTVVPEPSTILVLFSGFGCVVLCWRRKR